MTVVLQKLVGERLGPYNSFNPVSRVQVWQWCAAMGETCPLYLDDEYRRSTEFADAGVVAPPTMMQVWTMRDFNLEWAPGSTTAHPYPVMRELEALGYTANVAVGYDMSFHRYLLEGDRVHHYKSVASISDLKTTALGEGYFFTDRMEYLDQHGALFAEALITYFQYAPIQVAADSMPAPVPPEIPIGPAQGDEADARQFAAARLEVGESLPVQTIPLTHRLIVGGAIATQDYIPVHHNAPAARAAGMPDIFMNILTSCGLLGSCLGRWAGQESRLRRLQFKLMAPNTPGDTMSVTGRVEELQSTDAEALATVSFTGRNSLGPHVSGSATLALPRGDYEGNIDG